MEEEKFYHIYNRANGFENLFITEENYNFFLRQWGKYINPIAETYAYCLMPNHFHFLIRIRSLNKIKTNVKLESSFGKFQTFQKMISKQFANFFSSYTQAFNKMHNRSGSLFTPNFKRKEITSEAYLSNIIFYIHHNPVHHGFTQTIADWKHSSFHAVVSTKKTELHRDYILEWFGGKREFQLFHHKSIKDLQNLENEFT